MKPPGVPKRTPIKRRSARRTPDDRVDGALHAHVINRDRMCFWSRVWLAVSLGENWVTREQAQRMGSHWCADKWGTLHQPGDLQRLTLDHFWHHAGGTKGDRAPSDASHLVAACAVLNDHGMTKMVRQLERQYIAWLTERGAV